MNIIRAAALRTSLNLRRILLSSLVLPLLIGANYCERRIPVPTVLPVVSTETAFTLLAKINNQTQINTLTARITLDFEDLAQVNKGTKRTIPTANGLLVLQRPENIHLLVEAPLFSLKVADMVSDGQHFRVAIYWPDASRKFVTGSNLRQYQKINDTGKSSNPDLERAGALANIRPQHLTNAILITGVMADANSLYYLEEHTEIEPDTRPNHKPGAEVERPYSIVGLLERNSDGTAQLLRKFWFDRSQTTSPLKRQQIFDNGEPVTDVTYVDPFEVNGFHFFKQIYIKRSKDNYAVTITFKPDSVQINNEVPQTAFVLENDSSLPVVDLDTMVKPGARTEAQSSKP